MKAIYNDGLARLYCADVLDWSLWYRAEIEAGRAQPMHAIVTDAPYSLGAPPPIVELLQAWLAGDKFDGFSPGFMARVWDVMPGPQIWHALYDIVYPGGYMFVFSGTRTADLLGIACRLGGWEPFDRIASFAWVQAQGMGKGANISKKLDASEVVPCPDCEGDGCETCGGSGEVVGVERVVVGWKVEPDGRVMGLEPQASARLCNPSDKQDRKFGADNRTLAERKTITAPATPLAQAFDGYNTQLAPKHEPVLLFRKPRDGRTFAQCAREFGSGGLWVDGCRVSCDDKAKFPAGVVSDTERVYGSGAGMYGGRPRPADGSPSGRWPPNVAFSHVAPDICPTCNGAGCDECHGEGVTGGCRRVGSKRVKPTGGRGETIRNSKMFFGQIENTGTSAGQTDADGLETVDDFSCIENCPVRALDEMAGERKSGAISPSHKRTASKTKNAYGERAAPPESSPASTGNASRFFVCHDWELDILERKLVDKRFYTCYNREKNQELNQCCENASFAAANSMLDRMMSKEGTVDFVASRALGQVNAKEERLTHGDNKINATGDGIDAGASQEVEKCTNNQKADGSGSLPTDQSQTDTIFTTRTMIQKTITCPTCNACLTLNIGPCTIASEKTTKFCLTVLRSDVASDAKNTSPFQTFLSEKQEHTTDIASHASLSILGNGEIETQNMSRHNEKSDTGKLKNLSTRQEMNNPCHDWSLEIAERLAGETPYAYVPKASRGERDAGLDSASGPGNAQRYGSIRQNRGAGYTEGSQARNTHACVKPLSLIKWLATLCLPPAQFSPRICVPFAGSGSEAIGAILAGGWAEIHAIEREQEYCEIAVARIAWWSKWAALTGKTDPAEIRKLGEAAEAREAWQGDERQTTMWELLE